jgi:hypothetical protein
MLIKACKKQFIMLIWGRVFSKHSKLPANHLCYHMGIRSNVARSTLLPVFRTNLASSAMLFRANDFETRYDFDI